MAPSGLGLADPGKKKSPGAEGKEEEEEEGEVETRAALWNEEGKERGGGGGGIKVAMHKKWGVEFRREMRRGSLEK